MNIPAPRAAALLLASIAGAACAQPTLVLLPVGYLVTDLSEDGTVATGNVVHDGSYETFRWARGEEPVRLGRDTVIPLGVGAGSPDISYDGSRISASILSSDTMLTQGLWDASTGWTETMPPPPPGAMPVDSTYGSAWGLSGDGATLSGFYRGNDGRAWASAWSVTTGMVHLPQTAGRSARVDAVSFDGAVACGWEESGFGPWLATAWRDGVKHTLADGDGGGGGGARAVNHDGSIVVGSEYAETMTTRVATIWTWNGSGYAMQHLGVLPGTVLGQGQAYLDSVSDDGTIAVGSNIYTFSPGGTRAGIVWTQAGGLVNAADFFASVGADQFPAGLVIRELTAVSPDGSAIAGTGLLSDTLEFQSFVLYLGTGPECAGDTNGDNIVNFADLNAVLGSFGQAGESLPGDVDGDGVVAFSDLNAVLTNFGADCAR